MRVLSFCLWWYRLPSVTRSGKRPLSFAKLSVRRSETLILGVGGDFFDERYDY